MAKSVLIVENNTEINQNYYLMYLYNLSLVFINYKLMSISISWYFLSFFSSFYSM